MAFSHGPGVAGGGGWLHSPFLPASAEPSVMLLASRVAGGIDESEYFLARFIVVIAPTAEWRKTCWRGSLPAELCK